MTSSRIKTALNIPENKISAVLKLLADGATIPFIARYRKEVTGSLDEVQISQIRDLNESFITFDKRKTAILESLTERGLLSAQLKQAIYASNSIQELEDLYLPHRPKKRTRASIARDKGLEGLAKELLLQNGQRIDFSKYINRSKDVNNRDEALEGARDILAEKISEDPQLRQQLRLAFSEHARMNSKVVKSKMDEAQKFRDYFDVSEKISRIRSHRLLAILRGESEKLLRVQVRPDEEITLRGVTRKYLKGRGFSSDQVKLACSDAYKRLIVPSLEKETLKLAKEKADQEAIQVFVSNLKELLLAAPLGHKTILAFDPGFRTGAKVVALDSQGTLLHYTNLFPTGSQKQQIDAAEHTQQLIKKHKIEAIAVGNGTAGRETESFLNELNLELPIISVDESGASIYSASESARKEFPDHDLTVRGAVSIGRRLQDPLAELVKLDPKSIGVGQYQHDVDQNLLKKSLDDLVASCVNSVGVDLNSASAELLSYVSGLGPKLAEAIVLFRDQNGPFSSRSDLKKVPRLGAKVFEQAAGFLRISQAKNPLDQSAVHPERYPLIKKIASDLQYSIKELLETPEVTDRIDLNKYLSSDIGLPTLKDIIAELKKPGRDPRPEFNLFSFDESVHKIEDLYVGMKLPGLITNVTNFGAFADIGVHQDGLIHVSKLSKTFVSDPHSVVKVRQQVEVTVMEVDIKRKRISLSLID